jgi:hypothetical protein
LLSAETPESKNPQAPAGYDDLILNYQYCLDYAFIAASLLSGFSMPASHRHRKRHKLSALSAAQAERAVKIKNNNLKKHNVAFIDVAITPEIHMGNLNRGEFGCVIDILDKKKRVAEFRTKNG